MDYKQRKEFVAKNNSRWKPFEPHKDTTLDYAFSTLYRALGIIELLEVEQERLSLLLTDFAKKIGTERERANKYWARAVKAERALKGK